jgi:hypothetical protein
VYVPAERADTFILFHLYPYALCGVAHTAVQRLFNRPDTEKCFMLQEASLGEEKEGGGGRIYKN